MDSAELAESLTTMEALAAGRAAWPPLAPAAAPAAAFAAVPPAAACRPALARASPVAIAAARSVSLGSDDGSALTAARLAVAAPCELSDEDEELRACAASSARTACAAPAQPLPWVAASDAAATAALAAAVDAEAAAEDTCERTAPPRRSKKRCSIEAGEAAAVRAMLVREGEVACRA